MKLLVVVASATGRTQRMAEALAEGAGEAGARVVVKAAGDADVDDLLAADAIVLGSGVHMAGMAAPMRDFFERTAHLWLQGRLVGRVGAAFASAGEGGRGGGELTLISLLAFLAENGLLLVPMHNRMAGFRDAGCHWGPLAHTNPVDGVPGPTEEQLEAARSHGRHVAECTARWLRGAADSAG
ncbi:MAG: NAD(P)H-dependent oxidoreductase [Myxococcota bacterium]